MATARLTCGQRIHRNKKDHCCKTGKTDSGRSECHFKNRIRSRSPQTCSKEHCVQARRALCPCCSSHASPRGQVLPLESGPILAKFPPFAGPLQRYPIAPWGTRFSPGMGTSRTTRGTVPRAGTTDDSPFVTSAQGIVPDSPFPHPMERAAGAPSFAQSSFRTKERRSEISFD